MTRDIGSPTLSGSASHASGVFVIDAAGLDISGRSDEFHFVYQRIGGDVDVRAKVDELDGVSSYAKAGVMIRSSLKADSPHAFSHVTVGAGVRAVRRLRSDGSSIVEEGTSAGAPRWVRAVRRGKKVTTYWSSNGSSWSAISSDTIAIGKAAYVGIAVVSRSRSARATARFSDVVLKSEALPEGLKNTDVGATPMAGTVLHDNGSYTIRAGGYDIWDSADRFHYLYQPVSGNVEIVARVASITYADEWSKAGVMIRESLTTSSRHAMTLVSAGKGYAFQRRPDTGVYSEHTSGGGGAAPGWVKLVRTGDRFESFRSGDGKTWTPIGADTIPMGFTVYAGIAVASHDLGKATTAVVDGFEVTAAPTDNLPPVVSMTAPVTGTRVTAPSTVTMTATASDPEDRMASVDFYVGSTLVHRDTAAPYSASWDASELGTYTLTAVAQDADGASSTSSAVTVTVTSETTTGGPTRVAFAASADHDTNVWKYVLKVFAAGTAVGAATPVAVSDLGKPAPPAAGHVIVDRAEFFGALPAGDYVATVTAVGPGGQTRSTVVAFTK
jgi:regulation of enolase protein 1 (concanavalin A-like superfamily)